MSLHNLSSKYFGCLIPTLFVALLSLCEPLLLCQEKMDLERSTITVQDYGSFLNEVATAAPLTSPLKLKVEVEENQTAGYRLQSASSEKATNHGDQSLDAITASNPNDLYDERMQGRYIMRTGLPGSYCYNLINSASTDSFNSYIVALSWNDALHYCDWCNHAASTSIADRLSYFPSSNFPAADKQLKSNLLTFRLVSADANAYEAAGEEVVESELEEMVSLILESEGVLSVILEGAFMTMGIEERSVITETPHDMLQVKGFDSSHSDLLPRLAIHNPFQLANDLSIQYRTSTPFFSTLHCQIKEAMDEYVMVGFPHASQTNHFTEAEYKKAQELEEHRKISFKERDKEIANEGYFQKDVFKALHDLLQKPIPDPTFEEYVIVFNDEPTKEDSLNEENKRSLSEKRFDNDQQEKPSSFVEENTRSLTRIFHHSRDEEAVKADEARQTKGCDDGCMRTYCPRSNSSLTQHPSVFPTSAVERDEISGLTIEEYINECRKKMDEFSAFRNQFREWPQKNAKNAKKMMKD